MPLAKQFYMSTLRQINPFQLQATIWCDVSHGQFYMCSYCIPVSCPDIRNKCPANQATVVKIERRPSWMSPTDALSLVL